MNDKHVCPVIVTGVGFEIKMKLLNFRTSAEFIKLLTQYLMYIYLCVWGTSQKEERLWLEYK